MTIQKFRDQDLSAYFYDTQADQVFSTRSGQPKAMKWSQTRSWYPKRVGMVTNRGYKVNYTYDQIKKMLAPAEVVQPVAITNDLSLLKPNFEYVMFSIQNRCSQYFYAGTSVQEALDRFAKRGECIKSQDVRILDPRTGKVSKLGVQTVETYTLI
jgi:hypothetical protein